MMPLDPSLLSPGQRLEQAIFTRQGVKLIAAGIALTESMIRSLHDLTTVKDGSGRAWNLVLADTPAEVRAAALMHEAPRPAPGAPSPTDVVTDSGELAIEAGQPIEPLHDEAFAYGAFAHPDKREARRTRAARMRLADEFVASLEPVWDSIPIKIKAVTSGAEPYERPVRKHGEHWPSDEKLSVFRAERVEAVRRIIGRCLAGVRTNVAEPLAIVDELIELARKFPARYAQLGLGASRAPDYLPDHCYTTAVLAVGIALRLGWGDAEVRSAGLAGMLADLGMAAIPIEARHATRALTEVEVNRVLRHPAMSVILMDVIDGLPEPVRRAAYQHHERDNGSGYPNRLKATKICDLAKAVAVADAYAAATEPRNHRQAKRPYAVLEELINLGSQRMYDRRFVRGLVEQCGLFPVGSYVELSTREVGRVIGAHADGVDRPIVRVVTRGADGPVEGPIVDLGEFEPWALHVLGPADAPWIDAGSSKRSG
ncbi:MAG: HD domain-containing protein [Phycisphaerales bacterium]|nr:HD domain-containing protein [Phycisphaerales bacterium]